VKNHSWLIKVLFAVSQLGADMYLLNAEMSSSQFNNILGNNNFHLIIYDFGLSPLIEGACYKNDKILSYHDYLPEINNLPNLYPVESLGENLKIRRSSAGKLVLLTGGTAGNSKEEAHKPSLFNYLNPFVTLITRLKLIKIILLILQYQFTMDMG